MNLLVDTHAVYWMMTDDARLPAGLRAGLQGGAHDVAVSAVSVWELEIKRAIGKLELDMDIVAGVEEAGMRTLAISVEHAVAAARLPLHHQDPFDRMLVAQARAQGLVLATRHRQLARYDVPILWD